MNEVADYFAEVRATADSRWEFGFDAHAQVFEPHKAIELGNALAPSQPMFLEEPLRPDHVPSWTHLRSQLRVPLATGESLYSAHEFLTLLTAGGVDIAQPDIAVVGGLSQMRRIATVAELHGHLELRDERPGWGVTVDEDALRKSDATVWTRRLHIRPDGSWGWA